MKAIAALVALAVLTCFGANPTAARSTPAQNRRAAERAAVSLLRLFVPPPRALRLSHEPSGDAGFLRRRSFSIGGQNVYTHAFWRVGERLDATVAFVKAHPPAKLSPGGGGSNGGPGIPANKSLDYLVRQPRGHPSRWIGITMAALRDGSTGIRVDAAAGWIIPRPPGEKVPSDTRVIDIRRPQFSRWVTGVAKVQTIVRWFDALGIVQGGTYNCPAILDGPRITIDFRSASRGLLARAVLPSGRYSTECNPIGFSIRGRPQTPLIGLDFWTRVKRLLGLTDR